MVIKKKRKVAKKRRAIKKRVIKKRVAKKRKPTRKVKAITRKAKGILKENIIGVVTHYFPKVRAGVVKIKAPLAIGDTIKIKGHTTDFTQSIASMQIDHVPITSAKKGQEIGLLVNSRVRRNDIVYKA